MFKGLSNISQSINQSKLYIYSTFHALSVHLKVLHRKIMTEMQHLPNLPLIHSSPPSKSPLTLPLQTVSHLKSAEEAIDRLVFNCISVKFALIML